MRILLVEDDVDLSQAIVHILQRDGYEVDAVYDGEEGLAFAESDYYDAIIFDVMLPKLDGFQAVEKLREAGIATPVLMLTALGEVPDKITGLDSGADSYMVKPFSPSELLARLRSLLRRNVVKHDEELCAGDLCLQPSTQSLKRGEETIQLSHKEYKLALLFLEHPNIVLTRSQIAARVWEDDKDVSDNNIEAYIKMLRKKLKFLGTAMGIKTERGLGYVLKDLSMDATKR